MLGFPLLRLAIAISVSADYEAIFATTAADVK
jgi:hypothetical protein